MGSPYVTREAVTLVQFPTPHIESYSQPENDLFDIKGQVLTYGPYSSIAPYGNFSFYLHYEHSIALPHFTRVERRIEVSHWGNIAIDEFYNLENLGAELSGEFSRVDFTSRTRPAGMNALENLEAVLPRSARGLYFRDELGNVSTSHARQHSNYVELEVEPRFPVMGGWRSNMNIGYNLPISYFVKSKENQFMLNTTFGIPFTDIVADELIVRVILPEGAWDIKPVLPFKVEDMYFETLNSYIDIVGRPVLVLVKKNAVDFHRKPFQVLYKFEKSSLLMEPVYLSGLVLGVLLLQICYLRVSLRVEEESKVKTE